jgi:hypothetical protein
VVISNRRWSTLTDKTHPAQSNSTLGRTVLVAFATTGHAIAYGGLTERTGCALSLASAFAYLYFILDQHKLGKNTTETLYGGAWTEVHREVSSPSLSTIRWQCTHFYWLWKMKSEYLEDQKDIKNWKRWYIPTENQRDKKKISQIINTMSSSMGH